ncbi:unnamed protein product [Acanthocheilonema viteae]|uniref:Uncharacterized protein n=1 Tax=Acanthocheilonema viteae TaxID=6277 RepID=A0A498S320_ACAVI|nr:unnamed protein product [Acanthocheilonema viteae]
MEDDNRYKYIDMGVNSLSLIVMIISYAVIIYKVRKSSQAIAKHQLMIKDTRSENGNDSYLKSSSFRTTRGQISKKEMRLFIQLRHEVGRLLCSSNAKTIPPTHRRYMLTSNKLLKYTAKNQSTGNSDSSSQHDGHYEASTTQTGHDLPATKTSDAADTNKVMVNSAIASMTMTMASNAATVDNDITSIVITIA